MSVIIDTKQHVSQQFLGFRGFVPVINVRDLNRFILYLCL